MDICPRDAYFCDPPVAITLEMTQRSLGATLMLCQTLLQKENYHLGIKKTITG